MDTKNMQATIAEKMEAQGLNLPALALATRIPYSTLQRKVRGGRIGSLTIAELAVIADALDCSPAELIEHTPMAAAA